MNKHLLLLVCLGLSVSAPLAAQAAGRDSQTLGVFGEVVQSSSTAVGGGLAANFGDGTVRGSADFNLFLVTGATVDFWELRADIMLMPKSAFTPFLGIGAAGLSGALGTFSKSVTGPEVELGLDFEGDGGFNLGLRGAGVITGGGTAVFGMVQLGYFFGK